MNYRNKEYKLNSMLEIIYLTSENQWRIVLGRMFDWDRDKVYLDLSEDYWQLDDIVEIPKDKIKNIRVSSFNPDWR